MYSLNRKMQKKLRQFCRKQTIFLILVLIAVVIGVTLGLQLNPSISKVRKSRLTEKQLYYLKFPGLIFLRMMKLLVVPLAVCSNISSLSSLNIRSAGVMGGWTLGCFIASNLMATTVGVILAVLIEPGKFGQTAQEAQKALNESVKNKLDIDETLMALLLNLVPENLVTAAFEKTDLEVQNMENGEPRFILKSDSDKANIFGLLTFSILFGLALQILGPRGVTVSQFFHECRQALIWIVSILIWYFPIGVASLVAARLARTDDLAGAMMKMTMYVVTMVTALSVQFFILNTIFLVITRKSPIKLFGDMLAALTCAVGTASSAATLPVTLKCLRRASYANVNVVRFLLPLGMTLNMNGTAVLQSVGPIFLMQCLGRTVTFWNVLLVIFSGYLATMLTGTMPSGALITIIISLDALKVPNSLISLMFPVDWLLDRFRTPINVYGNAVATGIVSHFLDKREDVKNSNIPCANNSVPDTVVEISALNLATFHEERNNNQTKSDSGYEEQILTEDIEDEMILNTVVMRF